MEFVLDLQDMQAPGVDFGSGHNDPPSNLSLLASCTNSTVSLLTCH